MERFDVLYRRVQGAMALVLFEGRTQTAYVMLVRWWAWWQAMTGMLN